MATTYKPTGELRFDDLFSGRLQKHSVYEHIIENTSTESRKSLTDGRNSVWVIGQPRGLVSELILKGNNYARVIFDAIFAEFQVKIASEDEPEFWGFQSPYEWRRARFLQQNEGFYERLLEHFNVRFHTNEVDTKRHPMVASDAVPLDPIELLQIDIATRLISEDRTLLTLAKKNELVVKIFDQIDEVREAFGLEREAVEEVRRQRWRVSVEEEHGEGSLPLGTLVFEINAQGVIVARERQGARARAEAAAGEVPF